MSYTTHNINSKTCAYGYRIQSYWNTLTKKYWNFLKKKHICPNCGQKSATTILTPPLLTTPKPKLSNSFELFITRTKANIQKEYEMFSYILAEHGERVHGSQRDSDSQTGLIGLPLYYKIPQGQGGEVKQKFDNIRNQIVTR
jgi:rubredoxin